MNSMIIKSLHLNQSLHLNHVYLHKNEPFSVNRGLKASAKRIDPGQPVQSANLLLIVIFLHIKPFQNNLFFLRVGAVQVF